MKLWNDKLGRIETVFVVLLLLIIIIIVVAMAVSVVMPLLLAWNIILIVFKSNMIVG